MLDFRTVDSSWIEGTTYYSTGNRKGVLVVWTKTAGYAYDDVPCSYRGLIHSGGGRAWNRVFRGKRKGFKVPNDLRPSN